MMNVTRRSFMQNMLALGAAPMIVRADSLMLMSPRVRRVPKTYSVRLAAPVVIVDGMIERVERLSDVTIYRYGGTFDLGVGAIGQVYRVWADGILLREIPAVIEGRMRFTDLDLTPYGNRIPSIEIEIKTDREIT